MPQASMTASFSCAVPLPPEMIAPAWPIRLPGGAVTPAMKPTTGFFMLAFTHRVAFRIVVEELHNVDVLHAVDRIAADSHGARLADAQLSELADRFIRERA